MSTSTAPPAQALRPAPVRFAPPAASPLYRLLIALTDAIDRHPARAFALLTLLYVIAVTTLSSFKLLWLDELITLHIARLNSAHAIWNALAQGADPNPPLIHLAVMLCRRVFGERELALRLPAILGYWLGMATLFLFLKRRLSPTWALAGTLMSMCMGGFEWSYESRSYAVFYGLTMLAFYCWSRTADDRSTRQHERYFLIGMAVALAAALCTNYFSVLAFFPIAAAEITRSILFVKRAQPGTRSAAFFRSAIRWQIWIGLLVAASPLIIFRPLIESSIAKFLPYAWNKVDFDRVIYGYLDMVEMTLYPLLVLLAVAIWLTWMGTFCENCRRSRRPALVGRLADAQARYATRSKPLQMWDAVGVFTLMTYPFLGYAVAKIRGGMLSPRFVIPVCFGFAIAGIIASYRVFGHLRRAGVTTLLFCLAWFVAREAYVGYWYVEQKQSLSKVFDRVPPPDYPGQPLALGDNLLILPFQHYAPPAIKSRIVFPVDFQAVMRRRGEASGETNIWTGRQFYNFPIIDLADLQRSSSFTVLTGSRDALVDDLRDHGYKVDLLPINTRAGALDDGTTPISHGSPIFFKAQK